MMLQEYPLPQLKSVEELFEDMNLTPIGHDLLKVAGGHPKTLEVVRDVLINNTSQNFSDLLKKVWDKSRTSILGIDHGRKLLASAICSIYVTITTPIVTEDDGLQLTTDGARAAGYCAYLKVLRNSSRVIPVLTPFQVIEYFTALDDTLGHHFMSSFRSRNEQALFGGLQFEIFHATFECFYRMLWSDEVLVRCQTAKIRELYEAAEFSPQFDDAEISLPDKIFFFEAPETCLDYFVENNRLTGDSCLATPWFVKTHFYNDNDDRGRKGVFPKIVSVAVRPCESWI